MFASVAVADYLYDALGAISGITSVVPTTRMTGAMVVPQGVALPALMFHMVYSEYGGVVDSTPAQNVTSETLRFEVRIIDDGTSDSVIYPAAKAQFNALAGIQVTHTFDGASWFLAFSAVGEIPLTTLMDGANIYRQLGTIYTVDVFRA